MKPVIDFFFLRFNILTTIFFIVGCIVSYMKSKGKDSSLDSLITKSLSYTLFPTSLALFICAFDKDYIEKLADIHLSLCVAAVALFYVAFKGIK